MKQPSKAQLLVKRLMGLGKIKLGIKVLFAVKDFFNFETIKIMYKPKKNLIRVIK